nr:MAG TPA: hypothetical protein [Caudoviricetes sp.]
MKLQSGQMSCILAYTVVFAQIILAICHTYW